MQGRRSARNARSPGESAPFYASIPNFRGAKCSNSRPRLAAFGPISFVSVIHMCSARRAHRPGVGAPGGDDSNNGRSHDESHPNHDRDGYRTMSINGSRA